MCFFHMYTAQSWGRQPIGEKKNYDNRKIFSLWSYVASFKTISLKNDFKHILNYFIHVYSARAGTDNPLGPNFDVNRNPLSLCPFVASLKKNSLKSDFLPFCMCFFHMYTAQSWGRQPIGEKKNYDNRKIFSLWSYVASFKMISSKSDFIHIFNDFIHVYSIGARAENPLGTNFWCQPKALITSTICCKFQTNLFEFWFYTHFLMFFHMYIALGQGQTTLCGQNFDVNRMVLSLWPFNIFEVWFYTYFCLFLYMYIAPGAGADNPWGQNFYFNINLLSLWSFAVSFFH